MTLKVTDNTVGYPGDSWASCCPCRWQ